eukprot:TRINITY_DN22304_c0_g1_i1.p1 TRINITY_DN22304_c0_g1~~TRINITY_DN22304_c0_g1_i1.p1  ORF type:complete len:360 (+),score=110.21 TRINITY_DN22304_c0_g1_i1:83-1081(+)
MQTTPRGQRRPSTTDSAASGCSTGSGGGRGAGLARAASGLGAGFSTGRKLCEVRGVYGAPARPWPNRLPALPSAGPSAGQTLPAQGAPSETASDCSRMRYTYGPEVHPTTAASAGRKQVLEAAAAAEQEERLRQQRQLSLRRKRAAQVPSQFMAPHVHDFNGNEDIKSLMREIERWTRKLRNCRVELDYRQREYLHVAAGGAPFDDAIESQTAFDSDEEPDPERLSCAGSAAPPRTDADDGAADDDAHDAAAAYDDDEGSEVGCPVADFAPQPPPAAAPPLQQQPPRRPPGGGDPGSGRHGEGAAHYVDDTLRAAVEAARRAAAAAQGAEAR